MVSWNGFSEKALLENQLSAAELLRWRGINHFKKIINVHFTDASKFEDLLKVSSQL